ncbi:MAG: hypothetical protein J1E39_09135 [Eubacterium sp.]|nr:hypothetical protein [Eubacterium sp.]
MDDKTRLQKDFEAIKKDVPDTPEEKSRVEDVILQNFAGGATSDDCTGLIPSGSGKDLDAYRELYPFAVPIKPENEKKNKKK